MAIRTDIHAHIGEVVIDRPPVNALDSKAWNELAAVIARIVQLNRGNFLTFRAVRNCEVPAGQGHGEVRTHW